MSKLYDRLLLDNIKLRYFLIALILITWIGQILRVARDISRRTQSTFFQIIAIIIATLGGPIIGRLIYLLIRPGQTLEQQMNYEPQYMTGPVCLNCKSENLESSNYCVFCGDMLKVSCAHCDYKYYKEYLYCPKCGNAKKDIDDGKDSDVSDASLSK